MSDDLAMSRAKWLYDVLDEELDVGIGPFGDGTDVPVHGCLNLVKVAGKIAADLTVWFTSPADNPTTTDSVPIQILPL